MKKMVCLLMCGFSILVHSQRVEAGPPSETAATIRVALYNIAGIPQNSLQMGMETAQRVFSRSGIGLQWTVISSADGISSDSDQHLVTLILTRLESTSTAGRDTGGRAIPGSAAWVYYDRVTSFVDGSGPKLARRLSREASLGEVLGVVIAHEIGHVLELEHAKRGIMRANWNPSDFSRGVGPELRFTREDTGQLKGVLNGRSKADAGSPASGKSAK